MTSPFFFPVKLVFIFNKLCMHMTPKNQMILVTKKQQPLDTPPPLPVPQRQLLGILLLILNNADVATF